MMPYRLQLLLICASLAITSNSLAQPIQHINPAGLPTSKSYTQVVAAQGSRTVYISGQVSSNAAGEIVNKGDFRGQVRQVYENLKTALAAVGGTFSDVVKTTTYVVNTDVNKVAAVREIRSQYYSTPNPPASTYVGVQGLYDKDILIEIEATAVLK